MGNNNQSISPNSTGFVNPNFISGNVPDHSLFDNDRSTGKTYWALAFKSSSK